MKRVVGAFVALAVAGLTVIAIPLGNGSAASRPLRAVALPFLVQDTAPGEYLLVVLGGVYPNREQADAANAAITFGDVAGYYVVPTAQFQGLGEQLPAPATSYALVSVFRTAEGARQFAALAQTLGRPATILSKRVMSLGGVYAGLGQEPAPDGSGPLLHPVRASLRP